MAKEYKTIQEVAGPLMLVKDVENGSAGSDYDTTDHKPTVIKSEDGKLYDLVPDSTKGQEKGKVAKGETEVTYVYKERAKGEVVVKYVIEGTSEEIKDAVTDTPSTYISDENGTQATYDTTDQKPSTITKDGKEYQLVEKAVPNEKGNLTEGTTTITYEYKLVTGTVTVKYEDENGQPIKEDTVITPANTPKGTVYDTTTETIRPQQIEKDGKTSTLTLIAIARAFSVLDPFLQTFETSQLTPKEEFELEEKRQKMIDKKPKRIYKVN